MTAADFGKPVEPLVAINNAIVLDASKSEALKNNEIFLLLTVFSTIEKYEDACDMFIFR